MIWKQFESMDEFAKVTMNDLLYNKYQNNIILNIIRKHKGQKIDSSKIRLVTVSDDKKILMIGVQTLPFQMLWYFPQDKYDEKVLNFYIDNVIANNWDLHQIQGDERSAKRFAEIYAKKTNKKFNNTENLIVYRLSELCNANFPKGRFRQCTLDDMNILPFWGVAFYQECGLEYIGTQLDYQITNITKDIESYYVWEIENHPVTMATMKEVSSDCGKISAVYTPPSFRGKGYAFANVWNICNLYKDKYKDIMLYADANYPQSNKVYQKVGFKSMFVNSKYVFENNDE